MRQLFLKLFVVLTATVFLAVPARAADREHQQIMADIRMLQEQTLRLHLMLGTLEGTLQSLLTTLDSQANDVVGRSSSCSRRCQ